MDKRDELVQRHFPTVMVPRYKREWFPECPMGKSRLLMAEDGLYIETRQPWGHLIENIWVSPRLLPYGPMEGEDTFMNALEIARTMLEPHLEEAERFAEDGVEWAAWVTWENGQWRVYTLNDEVGSVQVRSNLPKLRPGEHLVLDVHSHHKMAACFSSQDDNDDQGGVKIAQVMGQYETGKRLLDIQTRYCIEGFFITADLDPDTEDPINEDFEEGAL